MKRYDALADIHLPDAVITIGSFDGVHVGHQKIFRTLTGLGRSQHKPTAAITFYPHPALFFKRSAGPIYITPPGQQASLIADQGVDHLLTLQFDDDFAGQSAESFLRSVKAAIHFSHLVVGYDFALGKDRAGSLTQLAELSEELGYDLHIIPPVELPAGVPVSSSRIRSLISAGDMENVTPLLGRPFMLQGIVDHGIKLGRKLGLPTANIYPEPHQLLPAHGVYMTWARMGGRAYPSVTNIGTRPTVIENNDLKISVETYIIDFDQQVYGQPMQVEFVRYMRPEVKFDSLEQLKRQIETDITDAKRGLIRHA